MTESEARCKGCGYPLMGLPSGGCPECGRAFDWNKRTTYRLPHDKGAVAGMLLNRRWPATRFVLAFAPGLLLSVGYAAGVVEVGYWGCFILLAYPVWLVVCVALLLSVVAPLDRLSTGVSILLGVAAGAVLGMTGGIVGAAFGASGSLVGAVIGAAFGVAAGPVGALVYQHLELNNML
ncbi:MAG: hypothetical protein ACE37H_11605 [Phycisphaeraceae bacterium]